MKLLHLIADITTILFLDYKFDTLIFFEGTFNILLIWLALVDPKRSCFHRQDLKILRPK